MKMRLAIAVSVVGTAVLGAVAGGSAVAATPTASGTPVASVTASPSDAPSAAVSGSPSTGASTGTSGSPVSSGTPVAASPSNSTSGSPVQPSGSAAASGTPTGSAGQSGIPQASQGQTPVIGFPGVDAATNSRGIQGGPLVPGGKPAEFTETITNSGDKNTVVFPDLVIGGVAGSTFKPSQQKVEYFDQQDKAWHSLTPVPGFADAYVAAYQFAPTADDNWLFVDAGEQVEIQLRVTAGADTPAPGVAFVHADADGYTLDGQDNPVAQFTSSNDGFLDIRSAAATGGGASASASVAPSAASTAHPSLPSGATGAIAAQNGKVKKPAPAAVAAAKSNDHSVKGSAGHGAHGNLAYTGGGSDSTPIALTGAGVLAAGVLTVVAVRRRKGKHA